MFHNILIDLLFNSEMFLMDFLLSLIVEDSGVGQSHTFGKNKDAFAVISLMLSSLSKQ